MAGQTQLVEKKFRVDAAKFEQMRSLLAQCDPRGTGYGMVEETLNRICSAAVDREITRLQMEARKMAAFDRGPVNIDATQGD